LRIAIVTPAAPGSRHGNRTTAERWARHLRALGHEARVAVKWDGNESDLVIAEVVPSPPLESPGTAFDLVVRVENQGAGVATDVIGLISQTGGEAFATIVTGSAAMGDVAAGASTGTAEDALTFRLAVPFTCQETGAVSLDLTVAEASGLSVSQPVSFDVQCPAAPVITEAPPSRCAAVSGSGWWALAALLVGWRRRERY